MNIDISKTVHRLSCIVEVHFRQEFVVIPFKKWVKLGELLYVHLLNEYVTTIV